MDLMILSYILQGINCWTPGHPHKDALERMGAEGGKILRTDHMGAVEIKLKEEKLFIKYNSKDLSNKEFLPAKECDCEDCIKIKVNTHLKSRKSN